MGTVADLSGKEPFDFFKYWHEAFISEVEIPWNSALTRDNLFRIALIIAIQIKAMARNFVGDWAQTQALAYHDGKQQF